MEMRQSKAAPKAPEANIPWFSKIASEVKEFDKSGRVINFRPYTLRVISGQEFIEYPKNSGNLFYADGTACGRRVQMVDEATQKPIPGAFKMDLAAKHVAYVAPRSAVEEALTQREQQIAQLEAQLQRAEGKNAEVKNNVNAKLTQLESVGERQAKRIQELEAQLAAAQNSKPATVANGKAQA